MSIFKCKLRIFLAEIKYIKVKTSFFSRFNIFDAVNINFDPCLYRTLRISANIDVSGKLSGSAMSAGVEFQVDVFGVPKLKKKSAVSELVFIYL
jgi:hypothetical protein